MAVSIPFGCYLLQTVGLVSPPADSVAVTRFTAYSGTPGYGWEASPNEQSNAGNGIVEDRLLGENRASQAAGAASYDFRVDVANGTYNLYGAFGAYTNSLRTWVQILDGTSVLATIGADAGHANESYYDAAGTLYSAANWPANQAPRSITITTGILRIRLLRPTTTGRSAVSWFRIESAATSEGYGSVVGVGTLSGSSDTSHYGYGAIVGVGDLEGVSSTSYYGYGNVLGIGELSGISSTSYYGYGSVDGIGILSGISSTSYYGYGLIEGIGILAGTSNTQYYGYGAVDGIGLLEGTSSTPYYGAGSISGIGLLQGDGEAPIGEASGYGSVIGVGNLTGTSDTPYYGSGNLSGVGFLSGVGEAPGLDIPTGYGNISGVGELSGVSNTSYYGSGDVDGIGELDGSSNTSYFGFGELDGIGILTGVGITTRSGYGSITSVGLLNGVAALEILDPTKPHLLEIGYIREPRIYGGIVKQPEPAGIVIEQKLRVGICR